MSKLSDTQRNILEAAADRSDGAILPLPTHIKGGAVVKVLTSLRDKGLAEATDEPEDVRITDAGLVAIGRATDQPNSDNAHTASDSRDAEINDTTPPETPEANDTHPVADGDAEPAKTGSTIRQGTKQARMIEMLRRPEGATVAQIAEATGWQQHTVRGAMAGALKKRLGLNITSEKTDAGDRFYKVSE